MFEGAGFTDLNIRFDGDYLFVGCRKPDASPRNTAVDVGDQRELSGSAASA